LKFHNSKF